MIRKFRNFMGNIGKKPQPLIVNVGPAPVRTVDDAISGIHKAVGDLREISANHKEAAKRHQNNAAFQQKHAEMAEAEAKRADGIVENVTSFFGIKPTTGSSGSPA